MFCASPFVTPPSQPFRPVPRRRSLCRFQAQGRLPTIFLHFRFELAMRQHVKANMRLLPITASAEVLPFKMMQKMPSGLPKLAHLMMKEPNRTQPPDIYRHPAAEHKGEYVTYDSSPMTIPSSRSSAGSARLDKLKDVVLLLLQRHCVPICVPERLLDGI